MENPELVAAHVHRWISRRPDDVNPLDWPAGPVSYDAYIHVIATMTPMQRPNAIQVSFRGKHVPGATPLVATHLLAHLRVRFPALVSEWSNPNLLTIS